MKTLPILPNRAALNGRSSNPNADDSSKTTAPMTKDSNNNTVSGNGNGKDNDPHNNPGRTNNTLSAFGIVAALSATGAVVTSLIKPDLLGETATQGIVKPVLTFLAILTGTIFCAGKLKEEQPRSIGANPTGF